MNTDVEALIAQTRGTPVRLVLAGIVLALLLVLTGGLASLALPGGKEAAAPLAGRLVALAMALAFVLAGALVALVVVPIRRISRALNAMAQQLNESSRRSDSSEQMRRTVFNATPVAMVVFDSSEVSRDAPDLKRGMKVIDVNAAWEKLTLHSREEALSQSSTDLDLWDNEADRRRFYDAMLAGGTLDNYEALQRREDGSRYFASISLREAAVGKGRLLVLAIEDITARKEAEARLLDLNRQLRTMFDAAVEVAIISTDAQGRVKVFNRGAERMLGFAEQEALGESVLGYFVAEEISSQARILAETSGQSSSGMAVLEALAHDESTQVRAWRLVRKDGTRLNVSLALSAVRDEQARLTGFLFLARDVTEQLGAQADLLKLNQQLDQRVRERTQALQASTEQLQSALQHLQQAQARLVQSEKLASLGSIVAAVAHELNTPIGICVTVGSTLQEKTDRFDQQSAAGTLRKSQLDAYVEAQREGMQLLMRGLSKARDLVSNFKRVAVDQGGMQKRTRFSLSRVMADLEGLTRVTLKNMPYRLEIEVPPDLVMEGFPGAIEQVFTNLVNNSVAHGFSTRGEGLMCFCATSDGRQVTMRFTDDGRGMAPDVQRRIFDPFFTTALGQGGSGLGMAISYNLVTGPLGGSMEVASQPGRGTQFTIILPLVAPIGRGALGDTLPVTMS